jgi:hypothetical protein
MRRRTSPGPETSSSSPGPAAGSQSPQRTRLAAQRGWPRTPQSRRRTNEEAKPTEWCALQCGSCPDPAAVSAYSLSAHQLLNLSSANCGALDSYALFTGSILQPACPADIRLPARQGTKPTVVVSLSHWLPPCVRIPFRRFQFRSSSGAVARYSICSNVIGTVEPFIGVVLMRICWVEGELARSRRCRERGRTRG